MSADELLLPRVRRGDRVGELRALADEILFTEVEEEETVRRDYVPGYGQAREEDVAGLAYGDVEGVERDGVTVRLRTRGGDEAFTFEREPDAESFEALVAARIRA